MTNFNRHISDMVDEWEKLNHIRDFVISSDFMIREKMEKSSGTELEILNKRLKGITDYNCVELSLELDKLGEKILDLITYKMENENES